MLLSRTSVLGALALSVVSACTGDGSTSSSSSNAAATIQDSVGVQYTLDSSSGVPIATPANSSVSPLSCQIGNNGYDIFTLLRSRVLSIGAVRVTESGDLIFSEGSPARPIVCTSDAQCPNSSTTNGAVSSIYSCLNGLCQATSLELGTDDVISLCQADLPWPTGCPYILSKDYAARLAAISQNCTPGVKCATIPAGCRRPDLPAGSSTPVPPNPADAAVTPDAGDDSQ